MLVPADGLSSSLGSLDVPSPPPPVGQPLLDPQQQNFFDQFFNMPHDMVPSVDPSHIFEPEIPKDTAMWPTTVPRGFVPQMHTLPNGALSSPGPNNNYYGSHVPSAPSMGAPHIDLNPFTGNHEMMRSQNPQHPMSTAPGLLNFGTDTNFAPNGYHPPAVTAALDKDAEVRSKVYSALTRNGSAVTTAVNSPTEVKGDPEDDYGDEDSSPGMGEGGSISSQSGTGMKRRTEDGGDFTPSKSARKSRPRSSESASKSKKKPVQKRDNLTESQKRENHIHSEQKRRNLIRQGFEELCALVPELKAGGYSKSAVLIHAANYLDDLKKGNNRLRLYLQQLEGAGGQF